ncbi:hypothetical protein RhiirC2_872082 [Rhizophagus irregularis]|uniref:Uncharacterized protein n=1 Tax=Rhizophagus irregularis TaxID=588596 RepID=A0A2N1M3K0_9GLOM|nr:hypothetical protein RhiirC2_872082 [Rhizophagus irregularis]
MLYLLVQVNEGLKTVIPERIMSIEAAYQFYDLFEVITLGQYCDREVQIFVRREKSETWKEVDNGLNGDLKMLETLGFMQVKFLVVDTNSVIQDIPAPTQSRLNAFKILMDNSCKPLLPQYRTEYNNCDKLYNEIIELFRVQKVGWMGDALWYIDPHFSALNARSYHLPVFFTQLKTYQNDESYNTFYYTSHHKKNPLSHQKLAQLSSSLELSISQPWACDDLWNQVIPAIVSLIEIMRKYSEYLVATNNSMNKLHHSDKSSARGPENSSTMYRIAACENNNLSENYIRLNDVLFEKHYYEYINIQSYLPNDVMKRYRFIKNLQLTFPIDTIKETI